MVMLLDGVGLLLFGVVVVGELFVDFVMVFEVLVFMGECVFDEFVVGWSFVCDVNICFYVDWWVVDLVFFLVMVCVLVVLGGGGLWLV